MVAAGSPNPDDKTPCTIVHEILESKLPVEEKSFHRVFDDVSTITGAGFETTASALRLIFYHVGSNEEILRKLRIELGSAMASSTLALSPDTVELRALEQLPYLTAVLMEGMRLSPDIASRMARINPDEDLVYNNKRIPAGTPIGMTTLLMHTDENIYPDPMRFDPERWMELESRRKSDKPWQPFAKGTRNCLGIQ